MVALGELSTERDGATTRRRDPSSGRAPAMDRETA
jgi:hypothetical protein